MRRLIVGCVVGVLSGGVGVAGAATPTPMVSGPPTAVALEHQHPNKDCEGDHDTLTWSPPLDTGGEPLTGYHVTQFETGTDIPQVYNFDVGPEVTSLAVTPHVGWVYFFVYALTESGWSEDSAIAMFADGVPSAQSFDFTFDLDEVKPHSITTSASWFAQTKTAGMGGDPNDSKVTVTISPGGESKTYRAQGAGIGVPVTFRGLTPGLQYHFSVDVANKCGAAPTASSPGFTTGAAPEWVRSSPPLDASLGAHYRYRFRAKGTPTPTYSLYDAPEWLSIDPVTGIVSGKPPKGSDSFSYGVTARSTFGIEAIPETISTGPFDVAVNSSE